jgi:acyl-coenzyme A synthetase/AMP-(fatty) acid ligase
MTVHDHLSSRTMESTPGERVFPAEVDLQARTRPTKVFAVVPRSTNLADGYIDVTLSDFARAVDRLCEYLEPLIGYSNVFNTVAYYGPPDMRYHIAMAALCKLGHKALFSAPRNSVTMHLHLLNETQCTTILHAKQLDVSSMIGTHELQLFDVPELSELLWTVNEPKHYPYTKTFAEAKNDPFLVLHTSGSTGMPKPIVHRHGWLAAADLVMHLKPINGYRTMCSILGDECRGYKAFPPWHAGGGPICGIIAALWGDNAYVWGPTNRMPTPKDVADVLEYGNCDSFVAPPQVLEDLSKTPYVEKLTGLTTTWFGGGG